MTEDGSLDRQTRPLVRATLYTCSAGATIGTQSSLSGELCVYIV